MTARALGLEHRNPVHLGKAKVEDGGIIMFCRAKVPPVLAIVGDVHGELILSQGRGNAWSSSTTNIRMHSTRCCDDCRPRNYSLVDRAILIDLGRPCASRLEPVDAQ